LQRKAEAAAAQALEKTREERIKIEGPIRTVKQSIRPTKDPKLVATIDLARGSEIDVKPAEAQVQNLKIMIRLQGVSPKERRLSEVIISDEKTGVETLGIRNGPKSVILAETKVLTSKDVLRDEEAEKKRRVTKESTKNLGVVVPGSRKAMSTTRKNMIIIPSVRKSSAHHQIPLAKMTVAGRREILDLMKRMQEKMPGRAASQENVDQTPPQVVPPIATIRHLKIVILANVENLSVIKKMRVVEKTQRFPSRKRRIQGEIETVQTPTALKSHPPGNNASPKGNVIFIESS